MQFDCTRILLCWAWHLRLASISVAVKAKLLAQRLLRNSPAAMESTKRLLGRFSDHHLPDDIEAAIRASVDARSSADFQEGVTAFLEKRDPLWPSAHNSANPSTSTK